MAPLASCAEAEINVMKRERNGRGYEKAADKYGSGHDVFQGCTDRKRTRLFCRCMSVMIVFLHML